MEAVGHQLSVTPAPWWCGGGAHVVGGAPRADLSGLVARRRTRRTAGRWLRACGISEEATAIGEDAER